MTAVVRGDAYHVPLADNSVDAIITSPPYYALRSYRDDGSHYDGQIGSEPTPQQFLEALWVVTKECWRVLKPSGNCFINLGDKRNTAGGVSTQIFGMARHKANGDMKLAGRGGTKGFAGIRPKSKMLLPHRYAIGCEDGLADPDGVGWIVRQDMPWNKPNGLPESVTDRVRDSHEYWFHLVKQERYFFAIDEIRETYAPGTEARYASGYGPNTRADAGAINGSASTIFNGDTFGPNPLGKLPGSVWTIPSEPLTVPPWFIEDEAGWRFYGQPGATTNKHDPRGRILRRRFARHLWDLRREGRHPRIGHLDHFAAFPSEWPRRLILCGTPSGICTVCGEGRRPVVAKEHTLTQATNTPYKWDGDARAHDEAQQGHGRVIGTAGGRAQTNATITGYACACTPWRDHPGQRVPISERTGDIAAVPPGNAPRQALRVGDAPRTGPWREYLTDGWTPPPTRPAVVLDPFGGTGTTAMVARALGRTGISLDLSADYCRLAAWRIFRSGHAAKTRERTNKSRQGTLL